MDTAAVDAQTTAVAAIVGARLSDVSKDVWLRLINEISGLRGDELIVNLLAASVEENIASLLHMLEHGMAPADFSAPAAAVEYARRLAQRGMPMIALVRAYRIGHARFLQWCLEEIERQSGDADLVLAVTHRVLEVSFGYVDRISEQVVSEYQAERDHWLLTQATIRASRVQAVLHDDVIDIDATNVALGYRLRQTHVGVVAWLPEPAQRGAGLGQLDRMVCAIAAAVGSHGRPLFVPRDDSLAWAWLPIGSGSELSWAELRRVAREHAPARIAVGQPLASVDGFRATHRQALRAQDVALAARPGSAVTGFAEVGPIALLCADMDATRAWVAETLGDLTRDDDQHAYLRETLLDFLAAGGSYTATAEHLLLHKNTVLHRIRKAEEAIGYPINGRRGDLDLALRACKHLGTAVLIEPADA